MFLDGQENVYLSAENDIIYQTRIASHEGPMKECNRKTLTPHETPARQCEKGEVDLLSGEGRD